MFEREFSSFLKLYLCKFAFLCDIKDKRESSKLICWRMLDIYLFIYFTKEMIEYSQNISQIF